MRRAGLHIQGARPPAGMRIMPPAFQRIPGIGNRHKGGRRRHSEMEIAAEPRNDARHPGTLTRRLPHPDHILAAGITDSLCHASCMDAPFRNKMEYPVTRCRTANSGRTGP